MKQLIISSMLMFVMQWAIGQQSIDKLPKINKVVANDQSTVNISGDNGEASISYDKGEGKPYRVKEGVLYIDGASSVELTISNLSQIEANDASSVNIGGGMSKGFEAIGKDASTLNIEGNLDKVVVQGHDAATVNLSGSCSSLNVTSNDASSVNAGGMKADYVVAKSYDASSVTVNGQKNIDTQINDQSNIEILKGANAEGDEGIAITENEVEIEGDAEGDVYVDEGDLQFGKDMEKWSKKKLKWRPDQRVWSGIELSMVGFSDKFGSFDVADKDKLWRVEQPSLSLHLNLFEDKFKLGTEYVKFVTGFGFQWDVIRLQEDVNLVNTKDSVLIMPSLFAGELKKNTLVLGQIQIPLLLNFNTSPGRKRNFHIDAGVVVGYRFKQRQKQEISTTYKVDSESKVKSQFHQNPFDFTGTVRLGIGSWSVFGMYDLATLYKKNEGPQFNVWNIGVTVIPF